MICVNNDQGENTVEKWNHKKSLPGQRSVFRSVIRPQGEILWELLERLSGRENQSDLNRSKNLPHAGRRVVYGADDFSLLHKRTLSAISV